MVKFYSSTDNYPYPFPAVTLAYFLRYPNPYSTHVVSTDTIARSYDPDTQRLTTIRLHLKRSKLPAAVLRLVPRSLLGASAGGDTQSFILEKSVVDIKNGSMETESRNLEWTGVLSVVERQDFYRPRDVDAQVEEQVFKGMEGAARRHGFLDAKQENQPRGWFSFTKPSSSSSSSSSSSPSSAASQTPTTDTTKVLCNLAESTDVHSTVTLHSHIGEKWKQRRAAKAEDGTPLTDDNAPPEKEKMGFFKSWSTASLQRSIEMIGLKRARRSQPNAKEGMKVVLERMREGGLVAVLEGMARDREMMMGGHKLRMGRNVNDDDE